MKRARTQRRTTRQRADGKEKTAVRTSKPRASPGRRTHLSSADLDAMREICAIGTGHASTALSELTGKRVMITVPFVKDLRIEEIPPFLGPPSSRTATIHLHINGKLRGRVRPIGNFLLMFAEDDALRFVNLIQQDVSAELGEMEQDALMETGNLLSGASMNAISQVFSFTLIESLPDISVDMLKATLDGVLAGMARQAENALVFKTDFSIEGHRVRSDILLLFDPALYALLVRQLRSVYHGRKA